MVKVGARAPNFILPDANGRDVALDEFRGHWVLLNFYPADFSRVCSAQACEYRDRHEELERLDVHVIGINFEKPEAHRRFAAARGLSQVLLWDRRKKIARRYGALGLFALYCKRAYFLIDPKSRIVWQRIEPTPFTRRAFNEIVEAIETGRREYEEGKGRRKRRRP